MRELVRLLAGTAAAAAMCLALAGAAGALSASPPSVAFGNQLVGTTVTKNVTVTLDAGASFESVQAIDSFTAFSADPDTCAGASGPGTCNVKVSFTPPFDGTFSGDVLVKEDTGAGGIDTIDVPLGGTGLLAFAVSPTSLAFGNQLVGTTVTRNVTVTLDAGASFESVQAFDSFAAFSADPDTCAGASGPGTCNVKVSFTPPFDGALTGDVLVKELTGPVVQTIDMPLSGNGVTNSPPSADAGSDQTVNGAATVNLTGTGSSDPDGDTLTYAWTQTSGPTVTLTGAGTATARFAAPAGPATLTFQLQVCDPRSACDTDSVTVTVRSINDQFNILYNAVRNTPPGTALGDKVTQIRAYVAAQDKKRACKGLDELISLIRAQQGKKLTNAQVADFTVQVNAIKTALGC